MKYGAVLKRLLVVLLSCCALAQQRPPAIHGTWTVSAGPKQTYRGVWSGEALPGSSDSAHGSWAVLNTTNQIVLQGTWSAERSPEGWQGTWSAQVVTRQSSGRQQSGRAMSGTWRATEIDVEEKTLADLLRTMENQIGGTWRSGQLTGGWSVRRSP